MPVVKALALLMTLIAITTFGGCGPRETTIPGEYIGLPDGNAIIYEKLTKIIGGETDRLYIYADGSVIYTEDTNLRLPTKDNPPTRRWNKGSMSPEELNDLLEYLKDSGLDKLENYYVSPEQTFVGGPGTYGDMNLVLSINIEGLQKNVEATGYLTTDHGETYQNMPPPLSDIYSRLRSISLWTAEYATERVSTVGNAS